jgi:hypothetical protein
MIRGLSVLLVFSALIWVSLAASGHAQSSPFDRLTGGQGGRVQTAVWYERADRGGRFIFDRSASPALIWPEGSREVYAVYSNRASGGGEVWMTDTDRALLRFSSLGGATFFPPDKPDGVIAEELGSAHTLTANPATSAELQSAVRAMAVALARLSRHDVTAEVVERNPSENGYLADTAALVSLGAERAGRSALRDLRSVRIGVGDHADASFSDGVLSVTVAPQRGYAGRPSSDYIRRVLERGF